MKLLWKNSQTLWNSIFCFHKNRLIITSSIAVSAITLLAINTTSTHQNALACACSDQVDYNSMLPASHPQNRCALENKEINWTSWLSGNSSSSQFHFFDLFELLNNNRNKDFNEPTANDITTGG